MEHDKNLIKQIISRVIKVPVINLFDNDDLVEKYAMDSLARIEIITELEKAFDITIDDSAGLKLRSVSSCLELVIESRLNNE